MLFDMAMPASMTTPMRDMTFMRGAGEHKCQQNTRDARWKREQDDKRINERAELRHQDKVEQDDGHRSDRWQSCVKDSLIAEALPRTVIGYTWGN